MAILLVGIFLILLIISVPIAASLGVASMIVLRLLDIPLEMYAQKVLGATNSFPIMAILFFMLAGEIMSKGKLTQQLMEVAQAAVGFIRGSLAITSELVAMFFSALSGSSAATCAAIGTIMIDEMEKHGYPKLFTGAVISAAGITGIVIPPSITLVVYGTVTGTSVAKLFMGGMIPGILFIATQCVLSYFIAKKNNYGEVQAFSWKNLFISLKNSIFVLLMPVIILGGIYTGIFTPTEAGVVAVVYSFFVTYLNGTLKLKEYKMIIIKGAINSAAILFIIQTATIFSYIMTVERIPHLIGEFSTTLTTNRILFLMIVNLVFLVSGMLITGSATVAILAPIFLPVALRYGIDPVFLGVLMICNLAIGYITPPVGVDLYVTASIAQVPYLKIAKRVVPYLILLLINLILITIFPQIVMFLPNLM